MTDKSDFQEAVDSVSKVLIPAFEAFGEQVRKSAEAAAVSLAQLAQTIYTPEFQAILRKMAEDIPAARRQREEEALGYALPDWAWNVREQQREQFGSGNGRIDG